MHKHRLASEEGHCGLTLMSLRGEERKGKRPDRQRWVDGVLGQNLNISLAFGRTTLLASLRERCRSCIWANRCPNQTHGDIALHGRPRAMQPDTVDRTYRYLCTAATCLYKAYVRLAKACQPIGTRVSNICWSDANGHCKGEPPVCS